MATLDRQFDPILHPETPLTLDTHLMQEQGLTQCELCNRLYLNDQVVTLSAKQLGLSIHDYLQQATGWYLYGEHWYPPYSSLFCFTNKRYSYLD